MKIIVVLVAALLVGCTTPTPVGHSLPEPPVIIIERCPALKTLKDDETRLSEFVKTVTENYILYHECAAKHDLLVKWYAEQKALHDKLFNKK